jgi:hypothetical protein
MQRPAPSSATTHKILPVVTRVIEQLDTLFVELSGKSGLTETLFQQWLAQGKTGPSGLRYYVSALATQLETPALRNEFSERAERILLHLQSGYAS